VREPDPHLSRVRAPAPHHLGQDGLGPQASGRTGGSNEPGPPAPARPVGPHGRAADPSSRRDVGDGLGPEARLQRALDGAYRYLAKRDRTEAEVRRHLAARDADAASVDGAIEALKRQRYLDDGRYARTFAEDRRALDDWGPDRIERKLLALGVDPELVASALAERDGAAELAAAVALLRRRFREIPRTDRERERALGMLARKGYDLELAYDAVRTFTQT
jgi:regulatory protein